MKSLNDLMKLFFGSILKADGTVNTDSTGAPAPRVITDGTLSGTVHTQYVDALASTVTLLTFDPPIKGCVIEARTGVADTAGDDVVLLCFDPSNATIAAAWLTETNITPRFAVKPSDGRVSFWFNGSTVTEVYMKNPGAAGDLNVTVEGVA